jgi:hypothetical protein
MAENSISRFRSREESFFGLIDFQRITHTRERERSMVRVKTLTAKNPSEARGIRKALRAAGIKFEFKSAGKRHKKPKRNPERNGESGGPGANPARAGVKEKFFYLWVFAERFGNPCSLLPRRDRMVFPKRSATHHTTE